MMKMMKEFLKIFLIIIIIRMMIIICGSLVLKIMNLCLTLKFVLRKSKKLKKLKFLIIIIKIFWIAAQKVLMFIWMIIFMIRFICFRELEFLVLKMILRRRFFFRLKIKISKMKIIKKISNSLRFCMNNVMKRFIYQLVILLN